MEENVRERGLFPLLVPLGIVVCMAIIVFAFSRILLNVPRQVAVVVALLTALNVLVTCYLISVRKVEGFTALLLVVVIAAPVAIGGAAAAKFIDVKVPVKPVKVEALLLSANHTAFDKTTFKLAASGASIDFKNQDTVPHNVHIFNGPDGKSPSLFAGQIVTAGSSTTYKLPDLPAGTLFFRCDVHPAQMVGTVVVGPGGGAAPGSPSPAAPSAVAPASPTATVSPAAAGPAAGAAGAPAPSTGPTKGPVALSAANVAFNLTAISIQANTPTTVNFTNKDIVPHNFDIVSGPAGYKKPSATPAIVTGGQSATYSIPALPAGTYNFQCDVHPAQMKGTVTVA